MKKILLSVIFLLVISLGIDVSVYAEQLNDENLYGFSIITSGSSGYDGSGLNENVIRAGWGSELRIGLVYRNDSQYSVITGVSWDAVLPDGTMVKPVSVSSRGRALFLVPYEITGNVIVRAFINGEKEAELTIIILTDSLSGRPLAGWRRSLGDWHYIRDDGILARGWNIIDGNWFYFTEDGVLQIGWQKLSWNGEKNWYYFDTDEQIGVCGKMLKGWQKIGNTWYFFKNDGSMAVNEWAGGYWLSANGSWKYHPKGTWKHNGKGWWFEDTSGWYPKGETVKINGVTYTFDEKGYLVE